MSTPLEDAKNVAGYSNAFAVLPTEVVHMNSVRKGKPVFWIHAAAGGSSIGQYQPMADVSQRPFFAIKPPLIDINHYWLQGLEARAAYYVALIKSVEPEGPFDLGGYSMGSTMVYEVARQLEGAGNPVRSLILIDPTDMEYVKQWAAMRNLPDVGKKNLFLMSMNFALTSQRFNQNKPDQIATLDPLVHRNLLSDTTSLDDWLEEIVLLGRQRGLRLGKDQFKLRALQDYQLLESLIAHGYSRRFKPGKEMRGYVFINGSGNMHGTSAPYILMDDEMGAALERGYNAEWLDACSSFTQIALSSTTHFMPLQEADTLKPCVDVCRELYAR
ncbi:thioesterase domain-containing protein [Pseudomonas mucidolens]|uniref:Rhizoxin biosynthesis, polyketide synthase RhiF n=1 Tax=Pseudomonas mucidolens TaxID=46679 RepID=A0A1H2MET9_9PSED|nr:alpha/beta hydrolase [Pseudomonas mucidolens]SDU90986.1 rhizoxin biosynthesis, polyketide synthase RhiF [Pseudomonas mucidolens]SQH34117.1 polyketide synthase [Pseudomonas mucidolens]